MDEGALSERRGLGGEGWAGVGVVLAKKGLSADGALRRPPGRRAGGFSHTDNRSWGDIPGRRPSMGKGAEVGPSGDPARRVTGAKGDL